MRRERHAIGIVGRVINRRASARGNVTMYAASSLVIGLGYAVSSSLSVGGERGGGDQAASVADGKPRRAHQVYGRNKIKSEIPALMKWR